MTSLLTSALIVAATVMSGPLVTTPAAPQMLSLRRIGGDAAALQQAFTGFRFLGKYPGGLPDLGLRGESLGPNGYSPLFLMTFH